MNITEKKLPRGQVELTIELSVDEYQPFLKKSAQSISQSTNIPGFRPGKADYELIKKRVGEAQIWQNALDFAVQKTLLEALEQKNLTTIGSPQVDIVTLAPGNPVVYKVIMSLLPETKMADFSAIKVSRKQIEASKEELEKTFKQLQKMNAERIPVERGAKNDDELIIDFETFLDNIPVEHGAHQKFNVVLGEGAFIPGFEEKLLGVKKGETKEFKLEFPENYHQKNLAGKPVDFKVKVNEVNELKFSQIDDAFAQRIGFKSAKELEDKVTANLKEEATRKEEQRVEEEMLDALIDKTSFGDIPDALVDSETKKMISELKENIARQGVPFEEYLSHLKKSEGDLMLDFVPQAVKRVKSALIIREVAKQADVKVNDVEVEAEIEQMLAAYGGNPEIEKTLSTPDYKAYLKNVIASRKTMDYLKSKVIQ